MKEVEACYEFLKEFASEKVIYGINTGFGPMAQWRVDDKYLTDLQYNIISSLHSDGSRRTFGGHLCQKGGDDRPPGDLPSGPFGSPSGSCETSGGDDQQGHIPFHPSAW